jgi:glycosyltransferase involved in cell wall biosynthesis
MRVKTISVVMAVYNAERTIARTLDSLQWADEVLVMDSHSTDATGDICKRYPNCRVVQDPVNDINIKRNHAYVMVRSDWIMNFDADEIMPPALSEEIRGTISADSAEDGYFASNREFILGRWLYYVQGQHHRPQRYLLFKKGYLEWPGERTHEMPRIKGSWGFLKNWFDHRPLTNDISGILGKINRYSDEDMRKMTLAEAKKRFSWRKLFLFPFRNFLVMYVKHQGFRDGVAGFVLSVLISFNVFVEYAKLWEFIYVTHTDAA